MEGRKLNSPYNVCCWDGHSYHTVELESCSRSSEPSAPQTVSLSASGCTANLQTGLRHSTCTADIMTRLAAVGNSATDYKHATLLWFMCYPIKAAIFADSVYAKFYIHVTVHHDKFHNNKPTRQTNFLNLFWNETLHVSDSSSVHHQELSSRILILLESCLQTCMTYSIAEWTLNNSWRWTEELSETYSFIPK
jgi:hypothetical protein